MHLKDLLGSYDARQQDFFPAKRTTMWRSRRSKRDEASTKHHQNKTETWLQWDKDVFQKWREHERTKSPIRLTGWRHYKIWPRQELDMSGRWVHTIDIYPRRNRGLIRHELLNDQQETLQIWWQHGSDRMWTWMSKTWVEHNPKWQDDQITPRQIGIQPSAIVKYNTTTVSWCMETCEWCKFRIYIYILQ